MPFDAIVYRVMIASPSDVAAERRIIKDVIDEWTAVHAVDKQSVVLPVAWESHAAPEMGDRPQGIINTRLLKDADLLIAAFWTRIGTPTGQAASGTVEEIEEHIRTGKPAMIYFSQAPVRMDSVDQEQYEQLKAFQVNCQSRGLYETYETLGELREKLHRQLAHTMIRLCGTASTERVVTATDFVLSGAPTGQGDALSDDAIHILRRMGQAGAGSLIRMRVFGGPIISVSGDRINTQGDARDTARWEAAIDELQLQGLIEQTDSKGEIFKVTHSGYAQSDRLPPPNADV